MEGGIKEALLGALNVLYTTLVSGGTLGEEHWGALRRGLRAPDKESRLLALKIARQVVALRLEADLFRRTRIEINLVQWGI